MQFSNLFSTFIFFCAVVHLCILYTRRAFVHFVHPLLSELLKDSKNVCCEKQIKTSKKLSVHIDLIQLSLFLCLTFLFMHTQNVYNVHPVQRRENMLEEAGAVGLFLYSRSLYVHLPYFFLRLFSLQ
jgi:hypothetical protein